MDEHAMIRVELVRQQNDAKSTIHRGVVLLALVPLVLAAAVIAALALGSSGALIAMMSAVAYALIGGIAGMATIASGVVEHRRIGRQVREHDAVRQLPAARVVVR